MNKMNKFIAGLAIAGFTFGLTACGDDSSSTSAKEPDLAISGVVLGSDGKSGELRWIDKEGNISDKKGLGFNQDSKVFLNKGEIYVAEGFGADNLSKVDPEKIETEGKKAVLWQISFAENANPVDMAFDGENVWVALQNADSLVLLSTVDGSQVKSIKTTEFAKGGEASPYIKEIELKDGKLYAIFDRYYYDAEAEKLVYPKGLLAIYDASTGKLKDTIQLATPNPSAMAFVKEGLIVATHGDYNKDYGSDADNARGIEKVDLKNMKSELIVDGKALGGGVYMFAAEDGVAYAAINKVWGDVPLMKVDLAAKKAEKIAGVKNASGSLFVKDGTLYIGERVTDGEKVLVYKDGKVSALEQPKEALPPYSIALF